MRLRVLDGTTDKYGLNAWIFDSTNDSTTNYDKVLFSRTKSAADAVATIGKGVFADVKVKIQGGALDGKTAGMLVQVEELTPDLSRVRLFHTSVSRAIATWPTWPGEPGFTGDFAEYLAQTFPTSTAADFAILEAGVDERGDVRRAGPLLGHRPPADAQVRHEHLSPGPAARGRPDDRRVPAPVPGPGLDQAPERRGQPGLRRRRPQRRTRRPGRAAGGVHPHGLPGGRRDPDAGARPRGRQPGHLRLVGSRVRAAVPRDRRQQAARRPRPPLEAPDVELPDGGGGDDRVGEGLLGGRRPPDLPQRRRPRSGQRRPGRAVQADRGGRRRRDRREDPRRVQGARRSQRLDPRRQARGLEGHRPDLHQGRVALHPERPRQHRRHGQSRPGRATSSCSPTRRTSSTPRRRAR